MKKQKRSKKTLEKLYKEREKISQYVECRCPCCEREYKRLLVWSGKLPARKLCRECKKFADETLAGGIEIQQIIVGHRDYSTMLDCMRWE